MDNWLFESDGCRWQHDFGRAERVSFRYGPVRAYMEENVVLPGVTLYRAEAVGNAVFSIGMAGGPAERGRMVLGAMLAGRGTVSLEGCGPQAWRDDGRAYALTPIERGVTYDVTAENGWRAVAVCLEPEALDILGNDGRLPLIVKQALDGKRGDISDMAPVSSALRSVGQLLLRSPYDGAMQGLFRQAKVLEALAYLMEIFGGDAAEEIELSASELVRIRMARERLLLDLRSPPDLETLAGDVGLTAKRLNRGFRALYGMTVFNYLRDCRLDAARAALEGGTSLSLKQLAWELGYNQVSNFVTAFSRRFGLPPGRYRRGRGATS